MSGHAAGAGLVDPDHAGRRSLPRTSVAALIRIRWTVHHAMPWTSVTSLTARFVDVTAAQTFTVSRAVTLARAGGWVLISVNERRAQVST